MKHDFDRLKCPICMKLYKNKDRVFIDELNGLTHQECYSSHINGMPIKDRGTYNYVMEKYELIKTHNNIKRLE